MKKLEDLDEAELKTELTRLAPAYRRYEELAELIQAAKKFQKLLRAEAKRKRAA